MASSLRIAAAEAGPVRWADTGWLPSWLDVRTEQRTRYESLDGQFRAGRTGGDQALALRTSLAADLKLRPVGVLLEGMDSRQYLSDAGSPIDTTMVDALELLQAHARWDAGRLIPGGTNTVRLGRETLDLGMRRLVARNAFRNTINSFLGVDWLWQADDGGSVRGLWFLPVKRLPDDTARLLDNEPGWNSQSWDVQLQGLYAESPVLPGGLKAEAYWLRLQEEAAADTRRRRLNTPGLRIYRNPSPGRWDVESEAALQFGTSRSSAGIDGRDLDHFAYLIHAGAGWTFDGPAKPRVGVRYDEASGDRDPNDGSHGRFDTLYGARRFEFGPTGLYGAIGRSNLRSPDVSATVKPFRGWEAGAGWRWVWLAEARDAWTTGNIRDPRGMSGTHVGNQVELRLRWDALPGNLRVEGGMAHLFAGEFLRRAPNSTRQGDIQYVYAEVTWWY
jgi:hypothetical protein